MLATKLFNAKAFSQLIKARNLATIKGLKGREIIDSRGNPTVEVDIFTENGMFRASVPSGASTGIHEAVELRDGGARYAGKGVSKAVANVNGPIAKRVMGMDVTKQSEIDQAMIDLDGTANKGSLGANAILGVSLAVSKAGAAAKNVPLYQHYADLAGNTELILPVPSFNVINGGSHAGNRLAFQEFMILPVGAKSFSESMQMGCEVSPLLCQCLILLLTLIVSDFLCNIKVYHTLKSVIKKKYGQDACNVGDEGGFAPSIQSNYEGVDLLVEAIRKAGYEKEVKIGMDVAASEFLTKDGKYDLDFKSPTKDGSMVQTGPELAATFIDLCNKYPIVSVEDPFDQDDWENYAGFTKAIGKTVQVMY